MKQETGNKKVSSEQATILNSAGLQSGEKENRR
jgi:hypothetical protein